MNDAVAELLAKKYLEKENVADWAIKCLEKGYDSKSLRILASMNSFYPPSELDDYFNRSLKELGWDNLQKHEYLMRYARILAKEILEDKTDPIKAARDIYQILINIGYPSELHAWFEIDEIIWDYDYFLKTWTKGYYFNSKEQLIKEIKNASEELIKNEEK